MTIGSSILPKHLLAYVSKSSSYGESIQALGSSACGYWTMWTDYSCCQRAWKMPALWPKRPEFQFWLPHIWPLHNGMCTCLVKVVYPVFLNVCCVFMCQVTLAFNARHVGTAPSYTECHQGNLYMAPSWQSVWYHKGKVTLPVGAHTNS